MLLVAGATGSLGGKIVTAALHRGESVRGLVRPGSDAASLEAAGMSVSRGNLRDPATLAEACREVSTIVSTASATRREDDTPENVDARGNRNLIEAARAAGVDHFILVSTLGAAPDSPVPAMRAKAAAEAALRSSGLDFTIIQPNAFMDVWFGMMIELPLAQRREVTLVGESRRRHSFIAERDVVTFALAAMEHAEARGATLAVGGPDALTFRQVVDAYEAALGRSIPVRSVAPGEPIPGLPEPVWAFAAALETYDSPIEMEELAQTYGVALTSVEKFVARSGLVGGAA